MAAVLIAALDGAIAVSIVPANAAATAAVVVNAVVAIAVDVSTFEAMTVFDCCLIGTD